MILTAYFDESGTHNSCPYTVMSGWVAHNENWARFDRRWSKILQKNSLTHIHTKDLVKGSGEFAGWHEHKREHMCNYTSRIIQNYALFGLSAILYDDDYEKYYVADNKPKKIQLDSKYGLLFRICVSHVTETLLAQNYSEPIDLHIVLEDGAKNIGDAIRLFDVLKKHAKPEIAEMVKSVTVGQKQVPGLQAADMLAYSSLQLELKNLVEVKGGINIGVEGIKEHGLHNCPVSRLPIYPPVLEELKSHILTAIDLKKEFGTRKTISE